VLRLSQTREQWRSHGTIQKTRWPNANRLALLIRLLLVTAKTRNHTSINKTHTIPRHPNTHPEAAATRPSRDYDPKGETAKSPETVDERLVHTPAPAQYRTFTATRGLHTGDPHSAERTDVPGVKEDKGPRIRR
jgi:hypothetical protein